MADENNGGADAASPRFSVVAQYVKDFSFENPNAPRSFNTQPQSGLSLQVNVNGRQVAANDYEIDLLLEGGAGEGPGVVFKFELHYRTYLVFFDWDRADLTDRARQIIAEAVRNGGYPPLYVDPIDFHRLYLQRLQAAGAPAAANA